MIVLSLWKPCSSIELILCFRSNVLSSFHTLGCSGGLVLLLALGPPQSLGPYPTTTQLRAIHCACSGPSPSGMTITTGSAFFAASCLRLSRIFLILRHSCAHPWLHGHLPVGTRYGQLTTHKTRNTSPLQPHSHLAAAA